MEYAQNGLNVLLEHDKGITIFIFTLLNDLEELFLFSFVMDLSCLKGKIKEKLNCIFIQCFALM